MIIPFDAVSEEALHNIVESFVLREGTDYGEIEMTLEQKVQQVKDQLASGEAVLVYSELHESVDIQPSK